jgi:cell division protein ZapA
MEMGQVSVPVNGRSYAITCDDGQEIRIRRLAQYVDAKVAEFVGSVGQAGEARLLLLAALVIADELSDANDALERERNSAENASNARDETAGRVAPIAAGLQTP